MFEALKSGRTNGNLDKAMRQYDEIEKEFTSLICDIQNEYTQDKAIHIDKRIFDLYKLSNHEREIIGFVEIS